MNVSLSLLAIAIAAAPQSPRECPEIFGDAEATRENAVARADRLNFVMDGDPYVVVDQYHDWDYPEATTIDGVSLVDTSTAGALLEVDTDWAECAPGVYLVSADDSLGEDGRILAVVDGAILFEHDGELLYLSEEAAGPIEWRMAWTSDFSMKPYQPRGKSKVRRTRPRRRRGRRR